MALPVHTGAVTPRLEDSIFPVRMRALEALRKLESPALMVLEEKIVALQASEHVEVREWAIGFVDAGESSRRTVRVRVDLLPRPAGHRSAKLSNPRVAGRPPRGLKTRRFYEFGSCPSYKVPTAISRGAGQPVCGQRRAVHGSLCSYSTAVRGAARSLQNVPITCEYIRLQAY